MSGLPPDDRRCRHVCSPPANSRTVACRDFRPTTDVADMFVRLRRTHGLLHVGTSARRPTLPTCLFASGELPDCCMSGLPPDDRRCRHVCSPPANSRTVACRDFRPTTPRHLPSMCSRITRLLGEDVFRELTGFRLFTIAVSRSCLQNSEYRRFVCRGADRDVSI